MTGRQPESDQQAPFQDSHTPEMRHGRLGAFAIALGCLIGSLSAESGYRAYLYVTQSHQFVGDRNLWYFQSSPHQFSEEFGFEYVPGSYSGGAAYDGRIVECWDRMEEWEINERGNSGRIKGSYEDADLKILVFGDSFTQRARLDPNGDYMTWPNYLQDRLVANLAASVHVVNFGRDAYGVLQMFDLAVAKIQELKPDLAVFAFITDDLTRDRFWRTTTFLDGRERVMTSMVPDATPDWDTATDDYLVESRATVEWCRDLLESGAVNDPIVSDLEETLRLGRRRSTLLADPFSLTQSFVVDRIVHGDPYFSTYRSARPSQLPRHDWRDFAEDDRLRANVEALGRMGIPYVIVHLATYSELSRQDEYADADESERGLVESLGRLTGRPIERTLANLSLPVEDLESVPIASDDMHPSLRGHQLYAEAVAGILGQSEFLGVSTVDGREP